MKVEGGSHVCSFFFSPRNLFNYNDSFATKLAPTCMQGEAKIPMGLDACVYFTSDIYL